MSTFAVTIERLATVAPHPNADRLDIGTLLGLAFPCIVPRDQFKPGDLVVYIPEDAIVPAPLLERLNLTGKLAGVGLNRVKAVRLRGFISQGLVCSLADAGLSNIKSGRGPVVNHIVGDPGQAAILAPVLEGTNVTALLGITKYDPPIVDTPNALLRPLALIHRSKYDIESSDRYTAQLQALLDQRVAITEKLEGENFLVHCDDTGLHLGSHESIIQEKEGCVDFRCAHVRSMGYDKVALHIHQATGKPVTLYGELLGSGLSMGNYYRCEPQIRFFDIRIGNDFVTPYEFINLCGDHALPQVPFLAIGSTLREWLDGRTIRDASNGISALSVGPDNPCSLKREGIVIKPVIEASDPQIGRLVLKQRSAEYLV